MSNDALDRQEFLRRANNLKHTGTLENAQTLHAVNPLCGETHENDIMLDGTVVTGLKFRPKGCLVSKVSTDLLIDSVIGKDVADIKAMTLDDIVELLHTPLTPSRQKCALLGLKSIQEHLK